MTNRRRFAAVLNGEKPDRLPMVEWATWWNLTAERWEREGVPKIDGPDTLQNYFGLDPLRQIWVSPRGAGCPSPAFHGAGLLEDEAGYEAVRPFLSGRRTWNPLRSGRRSGGRATSGGTSPPGSPWRGFSGFPGRCSALKTTCTPFTITRS